MLLLIRFLFSMLFSGIYFVFMGRLPDARKSIARWADGMNRKYGWASNSAFSFMGIRYAYEPAKRDAAEKIIERHKNPDIYVLCRAITEVELLGHLNLTDRFITTKSGAFLADETHAVVEAELKRLGYTQS